MNPKNINELTFTFVTRDDFMPVFNGLRQKVFAENNDINYSQYWSEEENSKFKDLMSKHKTEVRSFLLCKDGEETA